MYGDVVVHAGNVDPAGNGVMVVLVTEPTVSCDGAKLKSVNVPPPVPPPPVLPLQACPAVSEGLFT